MESHKYISLTHSFTKHPSHFFFPSHIAHRIASTSHTHSHSISSCLAAMAGTEAADVVKTMVRELLEGAEVPPRRLQDAVAALLGTRLPEATVAAFLTALQLRHPLPTPTVLRACAEAMLLHAVPLPLPPSAADGPPLVDIVGTGGDGLDAFNVSTAAGLVMAACGARVAKHGNRSSSGAVGSADFLEALGARVRLDGPGTASVLEGCGFGFLFAQEFHPSMRRVAGARRAMGIRSIFNLLGPLTNPAQPACQVVGVADRALGPVFAQLLRARGARHALVVHSSDGLDELSPAAPTYAWEVRAGLEIEERLLDPQADFGLPPLSSLEAVCGGSAAARVAAFRRVLKGEPGPHRTFILLNAAAGLYVSGLVDTLREGVTRAAAALDSGAANALVVHYVALTKTVSSSSLEQPSTRDSVDTPSSPLPPRPSGDLDEERDVLGAGAKGTFNPGDQSSSSSDTAPAQGRARRSSNNAEPISPVRKGPPAVAALTRLLSDQRGSATPRGSLVPSSEDVAPVAGQHLQYTTAGGVRVTRTKVLIPDAALEVAELGEWLNTNLGGLMLSDYEQAGRYRKWVRGFSDPPLMLVGRHRDFTITALNDRGRVLLPALTVALHLNSTMETVDQKDNEITGVVAQPTGVFSEEERSKQASLFSVVRVIAGVFHAEEDDELGLQGAFGYDLTFQFEQTKLRLDRPEEQRDLVLFVPDSIFVWDQSTPDGYRYDYEFHVSSRMGKWSGDREPHVLEIGGEGEG